MELTLIALCTKCSLKQNIVREYKYEKAHFPVKTNYQSGCDYNNRKCTPYINTYTTSHRIHMW